MASPTPVIEAREPDTEAFCVGLAADAGVLLLPGEVYDVPGHVRIGLGRTRVPEALERLERYVVSL